MKRWYNYTKYSPGAKCRFCGHTAIFHLEIKNFGMDNQRAKWDKCKCDCPGFAPVDNLEYLEMVHDESSSL